MAAGEEKHGQDEQRTKVILPGQAAQDLDQEFAVEVVLGAGATLHGRLLQVAVTGKPVLEVRGQPAPGGIDLGAGGAVVDHHYPPGGLTGRPHRAGQAVEEDGRQPGFPLGQGTEGRRHGQGEGAAFSPELGGQGRHGLCQGGAEAKEEGQEQKVPAPVRESGAQPGLQDGGGPAVEPVAGYLIRMGQGDWRHGLAQVLGQALGQGPQG